ncbi:MAG: enolase C-terminal domain-like protein [Planctomycetota bacterium]
MPNPYDVRIVESHIDFEAVRFRTPLKFGGRTVSRTNLINASVIVETADGRRAEGFGSMPVGNVWAWPSQVTTANDAESAMQGLAKSVATLATDAGMMGHPIEIGTTLMEQYESLAADTCAAHQLQESMPRLATLVACSPIDAAIHDAYGKVHEISSYDALSGEFMNQDLSHYLGDSFVGEYLDQYTRRPPQPAMPLYHLVGALDPLGNSDLQSPIGDGLPETLHDWILADGLTHMKIKLSGEDLQWDKQRVLDIETIATHAQSIRGCDAWFYSLDFNERCDSAQYVIELLQMLQTQRPECWARIQYIEQPTHRDLDRHPENRMHEAAKIKPVVIDESLVSLESLNQAVGQGYTGVAFKACKGQTETLLLAAAAIKQNLFLCVQDLTCPGYSFLHSASIAARIPGVTAIEGNGRQYCPAPNAEYAAQYPGLFQIDRGVVQTQLLRGPGLFGGTDLRKQSQ